MLSRQSGGEEEEDRQSLLLSTQFEEAPEHIGEAVGFGKRGRGVLK